MATEQLICRYFPLLSYSERRSGNSNGKLNLPDLNDFVARLPYKLVSRLACRQFLLVYMGFILTPIWHNFIIASFF